MKFELALLDADKPEMFVVVRRIPQAMLNNAGYAARAYVHKEMGLADTMEPFKKEETLRYWFELSELVKGHAEGWRAADGGELPAFDRAEFAKFIDGLNVDSRQFVGLAYLNALSADQKKAAPAENGGEASSTS